jgi:hypothetical protein
MNTQSTPQQPNSLFADLAEMIVCKPKHKTACLYNDPLAALLGEESNAQLMGEALFDELEYLVSEAADEQGDSTGESGYIATLWQQMPKLTDRKAQQAGVARQHAAFSTWVLWECLAYLATEPSDKEHNNPFDVRRARFETLFAYLTTDSTQTDSGSDALEREYVEMSRAAREFLHAGIYHVSTVIAAKFAFVSPVLASLQCLHEGCSAATHRLGEWLADQVNISASDKSAAKTWFDAHEQHKLNLASQDRWARALFLLVTAQQHAIVTGSSERVVDVFYERHSRRETDGLMTFGARPNDGNRLLSTAKGAKPWLLCLRGFGLVQELYQTHGEVLQQAFAKHKEQT